VTRVNAALPAAFVYVTCSANCPRGLEVDGAVLLKLCELFGGDVAANLAAVHFVGHLRCSFALVLAPIYMGYICAANRETWFFRVLFLF